MVGVSTHSKRLAASYRFKAPKHAPLCMRIAQMIAPIYIRHILKVARIDIDQADLGILDRLRSSSLVLAPNHPAQDPVVLFQLSRKIRKGFFWMAARELLEDKIRGPFVNRIGVYSVDRGRRDTASLNTTVQLLKQNGNWVVIFPEGIHTLLHDEVMPFLPGAARLAFSALYELKQAGKELPPVYLVPVALRYYYLRDMQQAALDSLARLESRLGLSHNNQLLLQDRLGSISTLVLELNERHFRVVPASGDTEEERLEKLKELALRRVAEGLGVTFPDKDQLLRNRVRKLLNLISQLLDDEQRPGGVYARELSQMQRELVLRLRQDLGRIAVFMPLRWNYDKDVPTVENFLDVLNLLEMDLLEKERIWGPRGVRIKVGQPIDLREHFLDYQREPVSTSESITLRLETAVRDLLASMSNLMNPLPKSLIFQ